MKLNNINIVENARLTKLLRSIINKNWGIIPSNGHSGKPRKNLQTQRSQMDAKKGYDINDRAASGVAYTTGIPHKMRHQKFFGFKPPGSQFH